MTRPIQQSITLNAVPGELFNSFLDSREHAALTDAPAKIGSKAGALFIPFGGQLSGRRLLVGSCRLIVRSWRSSRWSASDPDSILMVEFSKAKGGGSIDLVQVGVPQRDRRGVINGWKKYYWVPWRKRLASGQVR